MADRVTITVVVDNYIDIFLPSACRLASTAMRPSHCPGWISTQALSWGPLITTPGNHRISVCIRDRTVFV